MRDRQWPRVHAFDAIRVWRHSGRCVSLNWPPPGVCSPRQHNRGGEQTRNLCESPARIRRRWGTEEAHTCPMRLQVRKFVARFGFVQIGKFRESSLSNEMAAIFFCKSAGPPGRLTSCMGESSSRNGSVSWDIQESQRPTTCVRVQRVCCACLKAVWDRICPPEACFESRRRARRFCSLRLHPSQQPRSAEHTRTRALRAPPCRGPAGDTCGRHEEAPTRGLSSASWLVRLGTRFATLELAHSEKFVTISAGWVRVLRKTWQRGAPTPRQRAALAATPGGVVTGEGGVCHTAHLPHRISHPSATYDVPAASLEPSIEPPGQRSRRCWWRARAACLR